MNSPAPPTHEIGCQCRGAGAGCLQLPPQDWDVQPAEPTGRTPTGVMVWDAQPGRVLAWAGRGDRLHIHTAMLTGSGYAMGGAEGTAGPDLYHEFPDACRAVARYLASMTSYRNLAQFYATRPAREASPEADFGVMWTDGARRWPQWRVSYVRDTGEVYAVQPGALVRVLGHCPADDPGTVRRAGSYYSTLDDVLDGWADRDVSGCRLSWVARRLAVHAAAVTA